MIWSKLWKFFRIPPKIAFVKALNVVRERFSSSDESKFIRKFYFEKEHNQIHSLNSGFFVIPDEEFLTKKGKLLRYLAENFLQHRFNLLGTGWINRNHTKSINEIIASIPTFWQTKAKEFYEFLFIHDYKPLNFWNDPRSGFLWQPIFFKNTSLILGADIKQPWELGRMQHLPILAYCYHYFKEKDYKFSIKCFNEFKNEIIDFIASNPVGFSVQWASPMDVSIRLANWLVAYDLFVSSGCNFEDWFIKNFFNSINQHVEFIVENLEWSGGLRGNHYFANVTSLIFAGIYLPSSEFSAKLLAFGISELINETLFQFNEDGGNFESSTYYHLQTTEMLLISLYLLSLINKEKVNYIGEYLKRNKTITLGNRKIRKIRFVVDKEDESLVFPNNFLERIYKIIKFTRSICKPGGEYEQLGDNDSGYFLRLDYFFDNFKIGSELFPNVLKRFLLEELMNCLSANDGKKTYLLKCNKTKKYFFPAFEVNIYPKLLSFKKFGLYVIQSTEYSLFVRCGDIGQKGKGGHSHNDQLSVTLNVHGEDVFVDPGVFCYTCSEDERNKYRSVHLHNTLSIVNKEQNIWKTGTPEELFWVYKEKTKARLLKVSEDLIEVTHFAYGKPHIRKVYFKPQTILIIDILNLDCEKLLYFHLHPDIDIISSETDLFLVKGELKLKFSVDCSEFEIKPYEFCPQYGLKINSKKLIFKTKDKEITSRLDIL